MSRYGIDYYGLAYYGSDNPVTFDATPFTVTPAKQGQILLNWTDPTGNWSRLVITRNPYGYPLDPWDGDQVVSIYNGYDPLLYLDTNLPQGQYFYYSIFVLSLTQYNWVIAGKASAVSVKDCGNTKRLYEYLPSIYKITQPYTATTSNWENSDLYAFLSNFGFELDYEQTVTDLLREKYNTEKVNGVLVPTMMNQFGKTYEPAIGLQQNRRLLRDAITLTKQKGTKEGLIAFIKDFTGWGVPIPELGTPNPSTDGIRIGHNLMLDYNDSSFEQGNGHWLSSDGTAALDNLQMLNIKQLEVVSNVATLYIGPHNYDPGNDVYISGLAFPLFNSLTPYTLTATDQLNGTISFALTTADITLSSGYNLATGVYGLVTPSPEPWVEPTAPALFPNKSTGIISIYNESGGTQTISAYVGDDEPITKGIPVTAGLDYTFSIYASKGGYTARDVTAKVKWFDRFGVYISTSSGSSLLDDTVEFSDSYRPYVTDTAPTDAYYACPGVSIASVPDGEHHYFDAAQFEQSSSVNEFDEARQLHITLRANRINELINPHFAPPETPWVATNATTTVINEFVEPDVETFLITAASITSNVATVTLNYYHSYQVGDDVYINSVSGPSAADYNGIRTITAVTSNTFDYAVTASDSSISSGRVAPAGNGLELTATASDVYLDSWDGVTTSQLMGIYYPNTSYTFSVYTKMISQGGKVTASISWYDSSYSYITNDMGLSFISDADVWVRPYITAEAPSNAAYATVNLHWETDSGNVLIADMALFENSGLVLEYFDGSHGPGSVYDLVWENGVLNGGRSHLYKNRFSTQTRLFGATLEEQLPMGSTAAIYLAQPNT